MRLRLSALAAAIALATGVVASVAAASSGSTSTACDGGTVRWSPTRLWPPNHKMVSVTIGFNDPDNEGVADTVSLHVGTITNSEQGHEKGSTANTSPDSTGSGQSVSGPDNATVPDVSVTVHLRAERNGGDRAGRTYSIPVTCSTTDNPPETVVLHVLVPHDQGHRK